MNLAFKPDTSKIKKLQASRPPVKVELDGAADTGQNRRGKYRKWTNTELEVIEELLMLGLSHSAVARKMNIGIVAMQRKLHTHHINRRVKAERKKLIDKVMEKLNDE